jgi:pyruvate-formate lyase-activating enzyme
MPLGHDLMLRLLQLRIDTAQPASGEPWQQELVAQGLAQEAPGAPDLEAIELRYRRNPLEHIERLVFEYTTVCNLDCDHCRNGHVAPATEARPERLAEAVDRVVPLGIRRFDFIGGEVILYGAGWLRVVDHIRRHEGTTAAVISSGWFLGARDFKAAGVRYGDDGHLLTSLAEAGVTHVVFSLDGPATLHDRWRKVPGLHDRVLAGFDRVREAGMKPQVSLVVSPTLGEQELTSWLSSVAGALYGLDEGTPDTARIARLQRDPCNYISNFIDTGNAVQLRRGRQDLERWPDDLLRCKNFFRPHPSLRVQATGEISLCPLVDAGEGYGNLRTRSFLEILNTLQDAFPFRLHAERRIADYKRFLDPELFGGRFDHICALRTILAMIARRMEERGVSPEDLASIRAINEEVARKAGYLPASGKTSNGTRLPY